MMIATPTPTTEEARRLSTGEIYTPVKGQEPEYPCSKCPNASGCDNICNAYKDYEKMTYFYRYTAFDVSESGYIK